MSSHSNVYITILRTIPFVFSPPYIYDPRQIHRSPRKSPFISPLFLKIHCYGNVTQGICKSLWNVSNKSFQEQCGDSRGCSISGMSASCSNHTAYSIQHTEYSIQHIEYSIQHTAYRIQHTAYDIQHTVLSIIHHIYKHLCFSV